MVKILAVDDNLDILMTIETILKNNNYEVTKASSGSDAYNLLAKEEFDLVLMDIMMPGMDGMDTVIKIKEDPEIKEVPIIFLTAKTDKLSKGMGSIVGADYIEKPFDAVELMERITNVLNK